MNDWMCILMAVEVLCVFGPPMNVCIADLKGLEKGKAEEAHRLYKAAFSQSSR